MVSKSNTKYIIFFKNARFLLLLFCVSWGFLSFASPCLADVKKISFKYVTVTYSSEEQLEIFLEKIKPSGVTQVVSRIFLGQERPKSESLGRILDLLFQRVQIILDMPLPNLKVNLYIHPDQESLFAAFKKVSGGVNEVQGKLGANETLPSFYERGANTIHLQIERYNIGILAHEMAHCVTSKYFVIQPPTRVAELMSQYVDRVITSEGLE